MTFNYCLRTVCVVTLLFWKTISSNPDVFRLISNRRIVFNEGAVSISGLQESGNVKNTTDLDDLMTVESHLVYTAIKCTYSDGIVELLQTFFKFNEFGITAQTKTDVSDVNTLRWLRSSINHFKVTKSIVARMMDLLFNYSNAHAVLRCGNQSLLKSLLSINLYMYYSDTDQYSPYSVRDVSKSKFKQKYTSGNFMKFIENVRKLNEFVMEMIGEVESFRSDECSDDDSYNFSYVINEKLQEVSIEDTNQVQLMLKPTMEKLNLLINNGSDNYTAFRSYAYDPQYLLFENLLNYNQGFLKTVPIRWNGSEIDLTSACGKIKNGYSRLDDVLQYQHALISAVADIFYGQIYNMLMNSSTYKVEIQILRNNFNIFIENVMPSNCLSINGCDEIVNTNTLLTNNLQNYNDIELFMLLEERFRPEENKKSMYEKVKKNFLVDQYLAALVQNIRTDEQFASFANVFKLLSHVVHTN